MSARSLLPLVLALATSAHAQDVRLARVLPSCPADEVEMVDPAPGFADLGFGESVGLDGDHLLVGAPWDAYGVASVPGAIQVFELVNGSYSFRKRIVPSTSQPDDSFASEITVRNGLLYARSLDQVFVFARDEGGVGEWGEIACIPFPPPPTPAYWTPDHAVDSSGEILAISEGTNVYLHERNLGGSDAFGVSAVVPMPASPPNWSFGLNVAIEEDVLVVASSDSFVNPYWNFVFFFERDLGGPNNWGMSHVLPEGASSGGLYLGSDLGLQDDFVWIDDIFARYELARGTAGDPWTLVEEVDYCIDSQCSGTESTAALALRGGLFARAYVRTDLLLDEYGVEVHRRTTSTSGVPGIALVGEVPSSPRHRSFGRSVDVQGDQLVVGAPGTNGSTGVVHVFELGDCSAGRAPGPTRR